MTGMIVYRMSKLFAEADEDQLPETEFSADFTQAGWTADGTVASIPYPSFDELQRHMNDQFAGYVNDYHRDKWKKSFPDTDMPLKLFMESGWVVEWSDPSFTPLDILDETDMVMSADKLKEMIDG